MNSIAKYWSDFLQLIFPEVCVTCSDKLISQEKYICLKCLHDIPRTRFHLSKDNKIEQLFWGRVEIEKATSFFFFRKGSRYQKLIHYLKYKGYMEIGFEIGKHFALELAETEYFSTVDLIIPVPLHPKKLKKRGFNQSEWIAKGIAQGLQKPINNQSLQRILYTPTQTRKTRFDRWKNVDGIFDVTQNRNFNNKHVLIIDDVITTGSTIEACASAMKKIPGIKISVASLAFAEY